MKYDIGIGNNHQLIETVISRRPWWEDHKKSRKTPNFYWRRKVNIPFSMFKKEGTTKLFNRMERLVELHHKDNLFRNLWFHCIVIYHKSGKQYGCI